jgi:hypothetical protein
MDVSRIFLNLLSTFARRMTAHAYLKNENGTHGGPSFKGNLKQIGTRLNVPE